MEDGVTVPAQPAGPRQRKYLPRVMVQFETRGDCLQLPVMHSPQGRLPHIKLRIPLSQMEGGGRRIVQILQSLKGSERLKSSVPDLREKRDTSVKIRRKRKKHLKSSSSTFDIGDAPPAPTRQVPADSWGTVCSASTRTYFRVKQPPLDPSLRGRC